MLVVNMIPTGLGYWTVVTGTGALLLYTPRIVLPFNLTQNMFVSGALNVGIFFLHHMFAANFDKVTFSNAS